MLQGTRFLPCSPAPSQEVSRNFVSLLQLKFEVSLIIRPLWLGDTSKGTGRVATQALFPMEISLDEKTSFNQVPKLFQHYQAALFLPFFAVCWDTHTKKGVAADSCHLLLATLKTSVVSGDKSHFPGWGQHHSCIWKAWLLFQPCLLNTFPDCWAQGWEDRTWFATLKSSVLGEK